MTAKQRERWYLESNAAYADDKGMVMLIHGNGDDDDSETEPHTPPWVPTWVPLEASALNISVRKQDPPPRQQTSYSRKQDRRQQTSVTPEQKNTFPPCMILVPTSHC